MLADSGILDDRRSCIGSQQEYGGNSEDRFDCSCRADVRSRGKKERSTCSERNPKPHLILRVELVERVMTEDWINDNTAAYLLGVILSVPLPGCLIFCVFGTCLICYSASQWTLISP